MGKTGNCHEADIFSALIKTFACGCSGTEAGSGLGKLATPGGAGSGYPLITTKGVLVYLHMHSQQRLLITPSCSSIIVDSQAHVC